MPNVDLISLCEPVRLATLRRLGLFDSPADPAFDRLAHLASKLLHAPIALISLADTERQFFKSCVGLPEPVASQPEILLSHSLCQHVVSLGKPLIIYDVRSHPLVHDDPVIETGVGAYAGFPLITATSDVLGTLCVIDIVPRAWTVDEVSMLQDLAVTVMTEIELRINVIEAHEREQHYRSVIDNVREAVFQTDSLGVWTLLNHAWIELTGFSIHDCLGRSFVDFVHPDDRPRALECFHSLMKRMRKTCRYELRYLMSDGGFRWVEVQTRAISAVDGTVTGIAGTINDLTTRKLAEEVLREREERFRQLVENVREVIFLSTPGLTQMIYVNPAYEDVWGRTCASLYEQPRSFLEAVHEEDRVRVAGSILNGDESTWGEADEYRIVHTDGSIRWVRTRTFPVHNDAGQVYRIVGTAEDITDRRQAEEERDRFFAERKQVEVELRAARDELEQRVEERTTALALLSEANAELARASRLKDEFLASMSHELRTPLNAILGLSEALQEEVYGPLNTEQGSTLHNIEESGRHLLALINDILDLTKIEAGKMTLNIDSVAIEEVCQASLRLVRQTAHQKQLTLTTTFDSSVATILADTRRLKQILVNLLSNAVKFTPKGGRIGLEVMGDVAHEKVYLTVWDTGIGIAQEDIDRLFHPFVQLDSSLSRQYSGTGLGLALVYRMVELHGGSIAIESIVGKGSRFTISLPWDVPVTPLNTSRATPQDSEEPSSRHQTTKGVLSTVLLAEDNQRNITMFVDYLLVKGYQVVVARDGYEAVAQAREIHPAIVLMDIQMPGMDGIEAIRQIRADAQLANLPIIALTALAMPGDRERCLSAGANAYLSKPVSLRELAQAIETQLYGEYRKGALL